MMSRPVCTVLMATLAVSTTGLAAEKPFVQGRYLSGSMAAKAVAAAEAHCAKLGYQVAAALVDRSGNLQAFQRNSLAGSHTVGVSLAKAKTSASFQTPTLDLMTNPVLEPLNYASGVLLVGGGMPIRIGGQVYGGIGVSGAPPRKQLGDIDEDCAKVGIEAIREDIEFAE